MSFDLPRDVVFPVGQLDVRLVGAPHPLEANEPDAIERNWLSEKARQPALFDGKVVLLSQLAWRGGMLKGRCHLVRYATFMYWRSLRPVDSAEHVYAHAVLVSGDNALVAIRMASHTVNAGLAYFAAGSFEAVDFDAEGRVDLDFNMRREVMEETGIDLADAVAEPRIMALSKSTGTVVFRRYRHPAMADDLAAAIRAHVARDPEPEAEGPVLIRQGATWPERLAPQMPDLIEWHFANPMGLGSDLDHAEK